MASRWEYDVASSGEILSHGLRPSGRCHRVGIARDEKSRDIKGLERKVRCGQTGMREEFAGVHLLLHPIVT